MLTYLKIVVSIILGQIAVNFTNVLLTSSPDFNSFLAGNLRLVLLIITGNFLTILGWFWAYQNNISLFFIFVLTLGLGISAQTAGAILFVGQIPTIKQVAALVLLLIAGVLAR